MFRLTLRDAVTDLNWWHWAVTWLLLASYLAIGKLWPVYAAIGLCAVMLVVYAIALGRLKPWPVQIRAGFLLLLLVGLLPGMWWMYLSQLCGMSALLLLGYCPMHRMLLLMPWNRVVRLNVGYVQYAFLSPPGAGGVVRYQGGSTAALGAVCALRS